MATPFDSVDPNEARECPPQLHDNVPIIEENKTIGLVCLMCGKQIYENRVPSLTIVGTDGRITHLPYTTYHRKDPRF